MSLGALQESAMNTGTRARPRPRTGTCRAGSPAEHCSSCCWVGTRSCGTYV